MDPIFGKSDNVDPIFGIVLSAARKRKEKLIFLEQIRVCEHQRRARRGVETCIFIMGLFLI